VEPSGAVHFGGPLANSHVYRLPSGDEVWLERDGGSHPLDDLVIERFGIATTVALGRGHRDIDDLDQAALLQLAISTAASDTERHRALERLGVRATSTVHVLAMSGTADQLAEVGRCLPGRRQARVGAIEVLVATQPPRDTTAVPVDCRIGVASPHPAGELPEAWREARTALRLALPSRQPAPPYPPHEPAMVRYDALGGFAAIAEAVTTDQINRIPDVIALDKLTEQPGGEEMIRTLTAVAATDSLRRAAAILHMHHNSVAHRVARAEQFLGYSIADYHARPKLMLALALRQIRESASLF
jgi:sugar diacid utilization regulator